MFQGSGRKALRFAPVAALTTLAGSAYAAVPVAVTDAITDLSADATTVAVAMIGVIAGLLVFSYIRKQLH